MKIFAAKPQEVVVTHLPAKQEALRYYDQEVDETGRIAVPIPVVANCDERFKADGLLYPPDKNHAVYVARQRIVQEVVCVLLETIADFRLMMELSRAFPHLYLSEFLQVDGKDDRFNIGREILDAKARGEDIYPRPFKRDVSAGRALLNDTHHTFAEATGKSLSDEAPRSLFWHHPRQEVRDLVLGAPDDQAHTKLKMLVGSLGTDRHPRILEEVLGEQRRLAS